MSQLVVRRVFIIGGLDVGVVIFCPLYPQPATCRTLVPSLVPPELTVRVRLVVVMHLLPLLNEGLVVLLPVKNLLVLLTIQPARMSSLLESMYMSPY